MFDVRFNKVHVIVDELDIFKNVGNAVAHDEIIPFKISGQGKKLTVNDETSSIKNGQVRVEFVKVSETSNRHII